MKLGGLTWWRNNYGSILQAYALQEQLNSYPEIDYEIINQYSKRIASADNLLVKLKTIGIIKTAKKIVTKFGLKKLRQRNFKIQSFVDNKLKVSEKQYTAETIAETNKIYDGFICGSDQIWNPSFVKTDSIYWLNFAKKGKLKISYAPSVGVDRFSEEEAIAIKENLSDFKAVSCREESGTKAINSVIGGNCITVLDPTLMVKKKLWDTLCSKKLINEPYMFVYLLRGDKNQMKMIERYAKKRNLKIATIPFLESEHITRYGFKFGDYKLWDCAPDEFISAICYADCVITDSFHSSVFSCLYHTEFFTVPKKGKAQMNRITGLQQLLGIESRMVNNESDIYKVEKQKIDWKKLDEILEKKQAASQKYLTDALSIT